MRRALPHLVMLLVSVLLYWAAMQIDTRAAEGGRRIGPDFWPKLVIMVMGALCLYEVVKRLVVKTAFTADGLVEALHHNPAEPAPATDEEPAAAGAEPGAAQPPQREYPGRLLAGILAIGAFALGVDWLGFFVATALFLAGFMLIGGLRRPLLTFALAAAGSFALIVIFMRVAYISLPLGAGPFRALSLALLRLLGVS
ncbi:MAG: tripartite tricarboxylate transporter TctB family protein [Burkholderiaceae bacterium]|nr:tripartite tricarboxylate transporter TctB family protein [Burkholderiaceae bacterium]MEB2351236.1 tripartite tricarboxylate transporter TctB family protein [Burkholderiaceae bacterium]